MTTRYLNLKSAPAAGTEDTNMTILKTRDEVLKRINVGKTRDANIAWAVLQGYSFDAATKIVDEVMETLTEFYRVFK